MNRRDFLKAMGAGFVGALMPKAQQVKAEEHVGFVELTVEVDERDARIEELDSEVGFWQLRAEMWENLFFEWGKETNGLREQVRSLEADVWWEKTVKETHHSRNEILESQAADLAAQVAYWQEQYEQAVNLCDSWREKCVAITKAAMARPVAPAPTAFFVQMRNVERPDA